MLAELGPLQETLGKVASTDPPPEMFFDIMQPVDQAFVDVIVLSRIEAGNPILHGPQDEIRYLVGMHAAICEATDLGA